MKKALSVLLTVFLLLSLCGCRDLIEPDRPAEKPVIYLYPEETTQVTVKLDYITGKLTCTYPAYEGGWTVAAAPDGTLTDASGQTYNYLYWEGEGTERYDFSKGFCVPGGGTAAFLEEALAQLGLTRKEANEFIVYWLPRMEQSPYNLPAGGLHRIGQAHRHPRPRQHPAGLYGLAAPGGPGGHPCPDPARL